MAKAREGQVDKRKVDEREDLMEVRELKGVWQI